MIFWRINYNEFKQSSYESIEVTLRENKSIITFNTGNFVVDHYHFMQWVYNVLYDMYPDGFHMTHSSSVDHFFMDGKKYAERYFDAEKLDSPFLENEDVFKGDYESIPTVVGLTRHKSFMDVKKYVDKAEKKNGWSNPHFKRQ